MELVVRVILVGQEMSVSFFLKKRKKRDEGTLLRENKLIFIWLGKVGLII
jgi:hypothetical protein